MKITIECNAKEAAALTKGLKQEQPDREKEG